MNANVSDWSRFSVSVDWWMGTRTVHKIRRSRIPPVWIHHKQESLSVQGQPLTCPYICMGYIHYMYLHIYSVNKFTQVRVVVGGGFPKRTNFNRCIWWWWWLGGPKCPCGRVMGSPCDLWLTNGFMASVIWGTTSHEHTRKLRVSVTDTVVVSLSHSPFSLWTDLTIWKQ